MACKRVDEDTRVDVLVLSTCRSVGGGPDLGSIAVTVDTTQTKCVTTAL
jgi:hypothetical protein